ncbi:MAG: asparaginase [Burkholderiales bacterium RIFCSPLOWO2_02_FULL_57_36]|nr:MAG: asparaginase [Burkholderiales bacterium RIFCSPLOWO2_02_FULL_57_36]
MTLRILATGGTFDKHYDEITGKLVFGDSTLPAIIERARITVPAVLEQLPFMDSLEMQNTDRQRIEAACTQAAEQCIVIIHGTDTMRETAEVLAQAGLAKTIVLTGSMIPYEIAGSDALFNFGFAFGVVQALPNGVYIAMNGQVFEWDKVKKNRQAGIFERC